MISIKWDSLLDLEDIYREEKIQILSRIEKIILINSAQIERYMKENAKWTDRTGNLRQSLNSYPEIDTSEMSVVFDYGLNYGIYLEFNNAGRYAIIAPTLDVFRRRIFNQIRAVLT